VTSNDHVVRVVVTGVGAISGFGSGVARLWRGLLAGRSAIGRAALFADYEVQVAAMAPAALGSPTQPQLPGERAAALAVVAAREALADAAAAPAAPRPASRVGVGVVVGTTLGGLRAWAPYLRSLGGERRGTFALPTASSFAYHAPALAVAAEAGAEGPLLVPSIACASGTAAVGLGLDLIRSRRCDTVLAGGVDALSDFVFAGFQCLRALDRAPSRPFDQDRKGLSLGEGAAFLVLESEEAALARAARPRAEVAGFGLACDANHMTGPDRDGAGAARAMRAALDDAGIPPSEVAFVSAHGTGTQFNDAMEAQALATLLGPEHAARVPVNSIKSAIGHTLGAAGAFEAILCVLAIGEGLIPPTANLRRLDPEIHLDVVRGRPREQPVPIALSTTSGFAGANAAIVLRRYP